MAAAVEDPRPLPSTPALLYDGTCGLCAAFARLVAWADRDDRLRVLPFQDPEAQAWLVGWPADRIESAAHLVLPDGRVVSGPDALAGVLDRLPAVGPLHSAAGGSKLIQSLDAFAYRLGAALREGAWCRVSPPSEG